MSCLPEPAVPPDATPLSARLRELARTRTAAHSAEPLRRALHAQLGDRRIDELPVPFQCCAARIEDAAEHWFDRGPVVEAVLASAAVPGLLPAVRIGEQHYLDVNVAYRQACLNAIEYMKKFGYSGAQAYSILGTAPVQGHISGVVDIPNSCATLWLPTGIFEFDIRPGADGPTRFLDGSVSMPLAPDL